MWQQAVVCLIVLLAAGWAAWYWMPGRWRRALAARVARGSRRLGLRDAAATRIADAVGDAPGCGSCDSCGGCASPGKVPPAAHGEQTVRMPGR